MHETIRVRLTLEQMTRTYPMEQCRFNPSAVVCLEGFCLQLLARSSVFETNIAIESGHSLADATRPFSRRVQIHHLRWISEDSVNHL